MTAALALLLAQVLQPGLGDDGSPVIQPAPVAFRYYAASTGAMIPDDANTVEHIWWDGTRIHDTILGDAAWTQNGTVPQVASGPFYPHGFSQPAKAGAGPFSASNYYSMAAASSPLAFASAPFSVCVVFAPTTQDVASQAPLVSAGFYNGTSFSSGWDIQVSLGMRVYSSGTVYTISGQAAVAGAINVTCGGFASGTLYGTTNLGAMSSVSASYAQNTAYTSDLPGTWSPVFNGTIYELWAATGDYHAQFTRIEQGVLGMLASGGVPVANARSSTATDMIAGTLYTWPPNVSRIGANGLLSEPQTTNSALYSQQFDNAAWTKTSVTVTANTTTAPDTTVTADTLADTASGGNVSGAATTATASPYTVSAWLQTSTGTQAAQLDLYDATTSTVLCSATPTVTTTATRYSCSLTTNATAGDALVPRVWPGGTAGSGTTIAWGAQIEALPFMTSYTGEVLGTPVTRSADGITAVVPTAPQACGKINGAAMACQAFTGTTLSLPGSLSGGSTSTPQSLLDLCVGQGLAVCGP